MVDRVSITISPPIQIANERVKDFRKRSLEQLRVPMDEMGDDLANTTKIRIANRKDFEERPIRPLKQSTIDRRARRGIGGDHPLRERGKVQDSIVHRVQEKPNRTFLRIGPRGSRAGGKGNNALLNIHHHGGRNGNWILPRRQPLGLNSRNIREIKRQLEKHIEFQIKIVR